MNVWYWLQRNQRQSLPPSENNEQIYSSDKVDEKKNEIKKSNWFYKWIFRTTFRGQRGCLKYRWTATKIRIREIQQALYRLFFKQWIKISRTFYIPVNFFLLYLEFTLTFQHFRFDPYYFSNFKNQNWLNENVVSWKPWRSGSIL